MTNKKLGIIGFGWLGNHIAERLSAQFEIFATTTTPSKAQDLEAKGYHATLISFFDELDPEIKPWEIAKDLDAIIISVTGSLTVTAICAACAWASRMFRV